VKLEVESLSFAYGNEPTIEGLSFSVAKGEFVSLIGPSGSGKSTLFYLIGGLLSPTKGEIRLDGQPIRGSRGHVAYMPQQASLLPWRTITDNVALAQEISGKRDHEKIRALLKEAGLEEVAGRYPHELSGGMQQRVAFIRALASEKELLLLDEPFGALDALTRTRMQEWLLRILRQENRTILFITHSIEEAMLLSDRILVLDQKPMKLAEEWVVPFPKEQRFHLRGTTDWINIQKGIEQLLIPRVSP